LPKPAQQQKVFKKHEFRARGSKVQRAEAAASGWFNQGLQMEASGVFL